MAFVTTKSKNGGIIMNRNFLKISVSVVVLILALAFCLTGCKVDDVEVSLGDLQTVTDTNKADTTKALADLDAAIKALDAKIGSNITLEVEALNAAIAKAKAALETAHEEDKAELEESLEFAKEVILDMIEAVIDEVDAADAALSEKLDKTNETLATEVADLSQAIENAKAALTATTAANKAALDTALSSAQNALNAAIQQVADDLAAAKADLAGKIYGNSAAISNEVAKLNIALYNAKAALEAADANNRAELEAELAEAVETLNQAINGVKGDLAQVVTDLANAKAELQEAIDANSTTISTEVNRLDAAITAAQEALEQADADNKAALEALISNAKETLQASIDAITVELNTAKENITNNATSITALSEALEAAKAALAQADTDNKAALEAAIQAAQGTLQLAIDAVVSDLEDACADIEANATDIAALQEALEEAQTTLGNLAQADIDNKAALEAAIEAAKGTLQDAIDEVAANLATVSGKVEANITSIAALQTALADAQAALATKVDTTALENAINNAKTALQTEINNLKDNLEGQLGTLKTELEGTDAGFNNRITAIENALKITEDSNQIATIIATLATATQDIADLKASLAAYKEATDYSVWAVFEVEKTYNLASQCAAGWGGSISDDILQAREEAKLRLYRLTNKDEVNDIVVAFYNAIENINNTPELERLQAIKTLLEEARTAIDEGRLSDATAKLAEARVKLDEIGSTGYTIEGKDRLVISSIVPTEVVSGVVVDVRVGKILDLSDLYFAYRLEIINLYINKAHTTHTEAAVIDDAVANSIKADLDSAKALLDAVAVDLGIPGVSYDYNGSSMLMKYNQELAEIVNAYIDAANDVADNAATGADLAEAERYLGYARAYRPQFVTELENAYNLTELENAYNLGRTHVVSKYLDLAGDAIDAAEFDTAKELINGAKAVIVQMDTDGVDVSTLTASYNTTRSNLVNKYLELANALTTVDTTGVADITTAKDYIASAEAYLGTMTDAPASVTDPLGVNITNAKNNVFAKYVRLANALTTAAEASLEDVETAKGYLEAGKTYTAGVPAGYADGFNAARANVVNKYLDIAKAQIEAAQNLEELEDPEGATATIASAKAYKDIMAADSVDVSALEARIAEVEAKYKTKLVDFKAIALKAQMDHYIGNLAAIYNDINGMQDVGYDSIANVRLAYMDLETTYSSHFAGTPTQAVQALIDAEVKFDGVEHDRAAIVQLVDVDSVPVAAILDSTEFNAITGNKAEFDLINNYKTARDSWVVDLHAITDDYDLTEGSANKEAYDAIRASINESRFETINAEFEAAIAELIVAAQAVSKAVETLKNNVIPGNIKLTTIEDVRAAEAAMLTWNGKATDPDGVGFILEWQSNGALTHATLESTVNNYRAQYNSYLATAKSTWTACYTAYVQSLNADTISVYETALKAVVEWYNTYNKDGDVYGGLVNNAYAVDNGITGVGTKETYDDVINPLVTALNDKIAAAKAEAEAVQGDIDALGAAQVTTAYKNNITAVRSRYGAWKTTYGIVLDGSKDAENAALGFVVDIRNLEDKEDDLEALEAKLASLQGQISRELVNKSVTATSAKTEYFASSSEAKAYAATIATVKSNMANFVTANGGVDPFTAEEYLKVAEHELYAIKYTAIDKLDVALATAKGEADPSAVDQYGNNIYDRLDLYYAQYLEVVNTTNSVPTDNIVDPASYIAATGNKASTDMMAIVGEAIV